MKICIYLSAIVLALSASGSLSAAVQPNSPEESNQSKEANVPVAKKFALALNKFSGSIFKAEINNSKKRSNVAIVPLAINSLLNQLSSGAVGETKEQIASLTPGITENDLREGFQQLVNETNNSPDNGFSTANVEFVLEDERLKSDYQQTTKQYFGSKTEYFRDNKSAEQKFNNWLSDNINKNTSLSDDNDFTYGSRFYGYCGNFVAKFKTPFNIDSSDFNNFWFHKSVAQRVKYMYRQDTVYYGYIESLNATWIKLPLETEDSSRAYSLYFLVPNEYDDIDTLLGGLKEYFQEKTTADFKGNFGRIIFSVPKLKISSYQQDLKPSLKKMGLSAPFYKSRANFTNVSENGNFKISHLSYASHFLMSEEGIQFSFATKFVGKTVGTRVSLKPNSEPLPNESNPIPDQPNKTSDHLANEKSFSQSNQSSKETNESKNDSEKEGEEEEEEEEEEETSNENSPANALPIELLLDRPFATLIADDVTGFVLSYAAVYFPAYDKINY